MRILIIGARGLLGSFLYDKLHEKYSVFGSSRNKIKNYYKLDLNSRSDIKKIIKAGRFDVIINTSGLIDVNKCNKNLALAKKFNTQSIKKLSNVLKEVDQKGFVFFTNYGSRLQASLATAEWSEVAQLAADIHKCWLQ